MLFYIILTILLIQCECRKLYKESSSQECNRKASLVKSTSSSKSIQSADSYKQQNIIDANETYASPDQCNFTLAAPKMVINPYKLSIQNAVRQKPFSSLYLKCAACLAVAKQVILILNYSKNLYKS